MCGATETGVGVSLPSHASVSAPTTASGVVEGFAGAAEESKQDGGLCRSTVG